MKPETKKTFEVAIKLCLICSVVVSASAVALKGTQDRKKEEFRQRSILEAAGLWEDGADVGDLYKSKITPVVVDLETDSASERFEPDDSSLDLKTILRDPEKVADLPAEADVAGIKKREAYSVVYQVKDDDALQKIVLPIRGKGLWSTLYGFIAIDMTKADEGAEGLEVAGLTYYKHGETPGLGGEVDNALWKAKWQGKYIFDQEWDVKIEVAKNASGDYQVDALSGATLTSNGVSNMLKFWLGENGFGPYLQSLAADAPATSASGSEQTPADEVPANEASSGETESAGGESESAAE